MPHLQIGPNLKRELSDPNSLFWHRPANYDITPLAFQDSQGRYIACNLAFTNMACRPASQIRGRLPSDLFDSKVVAAMTRSREQSLAADFHTGTTFWQTFGHGPRLCMHCQCKPVFDQHGLIGFLSSFIDRTVVRQWTENVSDTMQVLQHDLQSPISAALFLLQERVRPVCPGPALTLLNQIFSQCKQITNTLHTCFNLSILAQSALSLRNVWLDPLSWTRHMDRRIRRRYGKTVEWHADCARAEAILWSPRNLSELVLGSIRILREYALHHPAQPLLLDVNLSSSDNEHLMIMAFPSVAIDPQALDILLSSHMAFLRTKAHGVRIQASSDSQMVRFALHFPRIETVSYDTPPPPTTPTWADYDGDTFDQPYSLYQARFDLLNLAAAVVSSDHRILVCTRALAQLLHRLPDEVLGHHYWDLASVPLAKTLNLLFSKLDAAHPHQSTFIPLSMEGRTLWPLINVCHAQEGHPCFFILANSTILNRQFLDYHLQETIERIHVHLNQMQTLYNRLLSHFPPEHDLHSLILELTQSNDDMLDLSTAWVQANRIVSEENAYSPQHLDLTLLLDQIQENARLRRYPVQFVWVPDVQTSASPIPLLADPALIKTMFLNLLKNAHQASQKHDIRFSVHLSPQSVDIDIRNDGEVPQSIRRTFFEKKVKGPSSSGMGLGTYSAKLTAERHGGTLALDTSEPGYTTLHITLPLSISHS